MDESQFPPVQTASEKRANPNGNACYVGYYKMSSTYFSKIFLLKVFDCLALSEKKCNTINEEESNSESEILNIFTFRVFLMRPKD